MVLLDRLWDDTVTGPHPQRILNKVYTKPFNIKDIRVEGSIKYQRSLSMPSPTPVTVRKAPFMTGFTAGRRGASTTRKCEQTSN